MDEGKLHTLHRFWPNIDHVQWNLDLVTLLVFRKTVTKSKVATKFIAQDADFK